MGFRFRRTFSLLPGIRLNLGATGPWVSVGRRGAKLTFGHGGVRATAGVPGTGMFVSEKLDTPRAAGQKLELPPEIEEVIKDRVPVPPVMGLGQRFEASFLNSKSCEN